MNKMKFDEMAWKFEVDTYGDVFGECSYGIGFCFDLATALYVYAMENADYEEEYIIRHALSSKPVEFRQSPIFSNTDFLAVDADAEYGDYTTSKMIYDDMIANPGNMQLYLDALIWACMEIEKKEEK